MTWMIAALLLGCAPDLRDGAGDDADAGEDHPDGEVWADGAVVITAEGGGYVVEIDASDEDAWIYYAFEVLGEADSADWDLRFRRYRVLHGEGLEVAALDGQDYDSLTAAPPDGYATDVEDPADDDGYAGVFDDWYDYDAETHVLTPADRVYVVRGEGAAWKLQFLSYYDDLGNAGHVRFRWADLEVE